MNRPRRVWPWTGLGRDEWRMLVCLVLWKVPMWARGRWYVALGRRLMRRWHGQAPR